MGSCRCSRTATVVFHGVPYCSAHSLVFVGTLPFMDFERYEAGESVPPRIARPLIHESEGGVFEGLQVGSGVLGGGVPAFSHGKRTARVGLHIVEAAS